jgi:hypothetical protein
MPLKDRSRKSHQLKTRRCCRSVRQIRPDIRDPDASACPLIDKLPALIPEEREHLLELLPRLGVEQFGIKHYREISAWLESTLPCDSKSMSPVPTPTRHCHFSKDSLYTHLHRLRSCRRAHYFCALTSLRMWLNITVADTTALLPSQDSRVCSLCRFCHGFASAFPQTIFLVVDIDGTS